MKPENGVKCTVSITEDDISRAYLLLAWRGLARLDGCLLTVAILLWLWDRSAWRPADSLQPELAAVVALAVLIPWLYLWQLQGRAKRACRQSKVYRSPLNYTFTAKGIAVNGPTFTAESHWSNVSRVHESRSLLVLTPPTSAVTIIPKRCFPDASALNAVRELIRTNVSGKVKLLP